MSHKLDNTHNYNILYFVSSAEPIEQIKKTYAFKSAPVLCGCLTVKFILNNDTPEKQPGETVINFVK